MTVAGIRLPPFSQGSSTPTGGLKLLMIDKQEVFHFSDSPLLVGNLINIWETVHDLFCFGPTVLGGSSHIW